MVVLHAAAGRALPIRSQHIGQQQKPHDISTRQAQIMFSPHCTQHDLHGAFSTGKPSASDWPEAASPVATSAPAVTGTLFVPVHTMSSAMAECSTRCLCPVSISRLFTG